MQRPAFLFFTVILVLASLTASRPPAKRIYNPHDAETSAATVEANHLIFQSLLGRLTNGRRLALGEAPKAPKKLFDASKVETATKAKRSTPSFTYFPFYCTTQAHHLAACCDQAAPDSSSGTVCGFGYGGDPTFGNCRVSLSPAYNQVPLCCNIIGLNPSTGQYDASECIQGAS